MTGPADVAALFGPPPPQPSQELRYRQGRIEAWNPVTFANLVNVGGVTLSNLPLLVAAEAVVLAQGDVVAVLVIGGEGGAKTYTILGRITVPS